MKINKITINNILSYKDATIEFNDDLNIFVGTNGSGKSNLMNILIYILKKFCYRNYEIGNVYSYENFDNQKYTITEKQPLYYGSDNLFLQKHKKLKDKESSIKLTFIFEQQDIENFKEIINNREILENFIGKKVSSFEFHESIYDVRKEDIVEFFYLQEEDLKINTPLELSIRETEEGWKIINEGKHLTYMKYFSLLEEIMKMLNVTNRIKNPFIFFEAYRNNSSATTKIGIMSNHSAQIANTQYWQNLLSIANSIGNNSTYIMAATMKFGKLMRNYIEEANGIEIFNNLPDYKKLKLFFKKFDYDIELKCINPEDNIYQFFLNKDDVHTEIDTISSGEREIINFIFGLFIEDMKDGIVIIDEPELHLHPNWQKKLVQILKDETKDRNIQILFVTHSSSFISYNILNNIYRIYKKDGFSECLRINDLLNENETEEIRKNLNIINATNNEKIFFSNYVILVEGITDEILLRKIYEVEIGKIEDGLEFISICGKENLNNFAYILSKLKISYYFIGDFDNIYNYEELKKYFVTDSKKQNKDLKQKKNQTYACLDLLKSIENLIANQNDENYQNLKENYERYNQRFLALIKNITLEQKLKINEYINEKYKENIYILKNGELEQYINMGIKDKAAGFNKVIEILRNKELYEEFRKTENYQELSTILKDINEKIINQTIRND